MAVFEISAEHFPERSVEDVRAFCRKKKIRVTRVMMDEIFRNFIRIRVSGDTKVVANRVRKFIWDEVNSGAFCEIRRVSR